MLEDHVFSIVINVPVSQVWNEITKTGRIQRAVVNTILESDLRPGSKLRYYSPSKERVFVVGEVVEVVPLKKFSHTYMFTFRPEQPTLVTWELAEVPGGCRVTLTHGGWTNQTETHKGVAGGWREILQLLKVELETGDIPLRKKATYFVMNALSFMLPRSTRVGEVARAGW